MAIKHAFVLQNDAELRRMSEFLVALRTPCAVHMNPTSWLARPGFEGDFRSKLLTHHCFMGSPLFQESFDAAFISACQEAHFEVQPAPPGQRFWDIRVDGRTLSLKSSKAKNLRADILHISKLTEAAWIQDCRTARMRQERTAQLFDDYCAQVDSIIQLRYFLEGNYYELVEVPAILLRQVLAVPRGCFASDGPTINIPIGRDPPDFTLKLDRSDSKVTLARINKTLCRVHGTWNL